jgi:hypothetical protein
MCKKQDADVGRKKGLLAGLQTAQGMGKGAGDYA